MHLIGAVGQHILRIAREEPVPFRPSDEHRLAGCVKRHARVASGSICSEYGKGVCFGPVLAVVAELSKRHRNRRGAGNRPYVLVDPKGQDFNRYQKVDVLTPNTKEAVEATQEMKNVSPGKVGMDSRTRHSDQTGRRSSSPRDKGSGRYRGEGHGDGGVRRYAVDENRCAGQYPWPGSPWAWSGPQ